MAILYSVRFTSPTEAIRQAHYNNYNITESNFRQAYYNNYNITEDNDSNPCKTQNRS